MKLLSILALCALAMPIPAMAGGNILNGPKNCRSLMGDAFEGGDPKAEKFDQICTKLENGTELTEGEARELTDRGVQLGHNRYGD